MGYFLFLFFLATVPTYLNGAPSKLSDSVTRAPQIYNPPKGQLQWPDNTRVYAATLQQQLAYMSDVHGDYHYLKLSTELDKGDVTSLHAAHLNFSAGTPNPSSPESIAQIPVISNRDASGWMKSESPPRKVLLILGDPRNPFSKAKSHDERVKETTMHQATFEMSAKQFKESLIRNFMNLSEDHVETITFATAKRIEEELRKLKVYSETEQSAELLVAFFGHGSAVEPVTRSGMGRHSALLPKDQGSLEGRFQLMGLESLSEENFKRAAHLYLTGFKSVAIINSSCQSGAWVAMNTDSSE